MKSVIPWSIKGIESDTREAAKAAAARSGLTLGQWMNSMIQEGAESEKKPKKSAKKNKASRKKNSKRTKQTAKKAANIDYRLSQLANQLTAISQNGQSTAVNSFVAYDDEPVANQALTAMIERIERGETMTRNSFESVNTRLTAIDEKLSGNEGESENQSPEFQALESALRNIVDHIETSEKRNRDALGNMQDRMSEISKKAESAKDTSVSQNAPALAALDARVAELAVQHEQATSSSKDEVRSYLEERLSTIGEQIDAVRHSTDAMTKRAELSASDVAKKESLQVEKRVASMIGEARELMLKSAPSGDMLGSIRNEIESLNQRFDDIKAESASDQDVQSLKLAIEQLTTSVSASPDMQPLAAMEQRLGELTHRLDETPANDHMAPQFAELEQRIISLDQQLGTAMEKQGDAAAFSALESQISVVAERMSATEEKLGALTTIEQSIAQLYNAIEDNKAEAHNVAQTVADGAAARMADEIMQQNAPALAPEGPSPELIALEQGLAAVKQNSQEAEQHNQETLEAVHETLEQIITKLANMEARDAAVQVPAQQPNIQEAPQAEMHAGPQTLPEAGNTDWQAAVQSHLQESLTTDPTSVDQTPVDPVFEQPTAEMGTPLTDQASDTSPAFTPEEIAEPQDPATLPDQPETVDLANTPPLDYIAQARRASQSAAPQEKSTGTSAVGFFTDKIMPGRKQDNQSSQDGQNDEGVKKTKSLFSLPFLSKMKTADNDQGEADQVMSDEKPASRKRLILAGLVLLIAAGSFAYSKVGGNQDPQTAPTASVPEKVIQQPVSPTAAPAPEKTSQTTPQITTQTTRQIKAKSVADLIKQVSLSVPQKNIQTDLLATADQTGMPANQALEAGNRTVDPILSNLNTAPSAAPSAASSAAPVDPVVTASLPPAPSSTHNVSSPLNIQTGARTSPPLAEETAQTPALQVEANLPPETTGTIELRNAAAKGDSSAQFVVASRYADGKRMKKDYVQAAAWYQKAASSGLPPAQYRLGTLFERGNGVPKDLNAARLWYERAAESGNVKAMHNLAVIYASAKGEQTNFVKAKKWFEKASNFGLKDSQYNLAVIHERGLAGQRSQKEALYWYSLAAAHGDRDAGVKAHSLKNYLTGPDIKEVEKRRAAWKPHKALKSGNFVAIKDPKWRVAGKNRSQPKLGEKPQLSGKLLVKTTQTLLSKMGFDVGGTDGVMGSRTANAVRLFQLQNGLQVNGMVTNALLQQLQARG